MWHASLYFFQSLYTFVIIRVCNVWSTYAGDECDKVIDPDNENQYIVWGVGGLGDTAFRHFVRAESEFGETFTNTTYSTSLTHTHTHAHTNILEYLNRVMASIIRSNLLYEQ